MNARVISGVLKNGSELFSVATGDLHPVIVVYDVPGAIYPFAGVGYGLSYYESPEPEAPALTNPQWKKLYASGLAERAEWLEDVFYW